MSTSDVPGFNPENRDKLACGAWAEHADGSLIFVQGLEGARVIYSLFDLSLQPPMEYRDAMKEGAFKKAFSWKSGEAVTEDRWTWHDKTPFPWDRIIQGGGKPGLKYASAADQISAARRVAEALKLKAKAIGPDITDRSARRVQKLARKLEKAMEQLPT